MNQLIRTACLLTIFFFSLLFAGCASQKVYLDRAIVRNETGAVISGIKVLHEPTGKFGEAHSILPYSQFELGFSKGPMQAESSTVTWRGQDGRKKSAKLELPTSGAGKAQGGAMVLFYTIYPDDNVTVELKE